MRVRFRYNFSACFIVFWLFGALSKVCRNENVRGASVTRVTVQGATVAGEHHSWIHHIKRSFAVPETVIKLFQITGLEIWIIRDLVNCDEL
jgi:hypothetical protein